MTTLSNIRERILTQLEAAAGLTEPLAVNTSSASLGELRSRLKSRLQDVSEDRWTNADLDEALRSALQHYSRYNPGHEIGTVTLTAAGREIDISSLTDVLRVEKVWWSYDASDPTYPPNFRQFEVWPGAIVHIDDTEEPQSGDVVRIWYTKVHTIDGLDGSAATTIPADDETTVITGACHYAAHSRAVELAEELNATDDVIDNLRKYADEMGINFRYMARLDLPRYVERARGYSQEDIDEAIRWAMYRYTEVKPHRNLTTVTLTADGREVDVSAIDYLDIERVWVNYDATDPRYRPEWADFEVWPGDILFINESEEPESGDVIRIFYTTEHTIENLDSATATTISDRDVNVLVTGAAGYAAQERIHEKEHWWGNRDLREWAFQRLKEFESALIRISRREGTIHSGVARTGALDRWDDDWA